MKSKILNESKRIGGNALLNQHQDKDPYNKNIYFSNLGKLGGRPRNMNMAELKALENSQTQSR